ncbi:MAG: putative ABC exporter domain-containing protein [Pirellulales bacterium]
MMHPALWFLLRLDARSGLRNLVRGKSTWRRIVLALFVLIFIGMIIGGQAISLSAARAGGQELQSVRFGSAMPFWALLYLLVTWLTAAADRGLVMRPAEVHFLIGGPFTARDIITLNLIRLAYRALISSIVLAGVGWAYMPNLPAGITGIWMLLSFSLLVGIFASLSARQALPRIVKFMRRAFSVLALAALFAMVGQALRDVGAGSEPITFSKVAAAASETSVGEIVLPPVRWLFAPLQERTFWPVVPLEVLMRAPIYLLLILAIYFVGGAFGEAAVERTDQAVARRQANLRSGAGGSSRLLRRFTLPEFGRWGGIGSVAWLEMLQSFRMLPRFMLYTSAIVGVVLVAPMAVNRERISGMAGLGWMAGLVSYADFLLLLQLPVAFLGPPAHRETFKQLPLPSWRIVVGLSAGPMLPLMVNHLAVTAMFLLLLKDQTTDVLLTAAALLPVGYILALTINLLGLWNIIKPRALQQRDALAAGRAMLSVWLFSVMLVPTLILGGLGALLARLCFGSTYRIWLVGGSVGVIVSCMIFIFLLARGFDRWQPQAGQVGDEEQEYDR